jgi:Uncharacterized protein conserved in bacteria
MSNNRILYLDVAKITAVVSMILLHFVAGGWPLRPVISFEWQVINVYDSIVRCCVPLFVMISGALFLNPNKEISLEKLFKKNILRIVTAFCFWSLCYGMAVVFWKDYHVNSTTITTVVALLAKRFILGHYHLWFLYTIVGLYMIVPFLRKITVDKKLMEYFLLLAFIFAIVIHGIKVIPILSEPIQYIFQEMMSFYFVLGYSFYFVCGYYLSQHVFSGPKKYILYASGISSVLFTMIMTSIISTREGQAISILYGYLLPNTAFSAIALFVFLKDTFQKIHFNDKTAQRISLVSKYSFGIYLVHAFFLPIAEKINGITTPYINPVFSIPLYTVFVFVCSYIVVMIIDKIPVLNRYIM